MTEISTGLEEIKQMLLGMQQRNKEFCDEQVIQIRSLRHTLSQAAAEHSRLQTLMAEPTQGFENPGSVETPVLKNDEDDSEIDGKGYDIEDNLSAVAEEKFVELPAVPSSAVVKVQFMPQYNFFIIDNIAECMEVCPVPSNYSEKTPEKFCTPGVCINVSMDMCSQLTASLSLNCTGRNFTGLKCEDSIHVGLDKPPPLPPEITLHVTNMVLGASFSSILECKNYDRGGQVQSIGGTNFTGFDLASLYATSYIHLGVSDSSLDHVLLLSYCPTHGANFVEQASKFDQVVSREDVIKSVIRIPSRRTEHSFALIGEPSVYSQRIRMQISSHPRRYSRPPAMEIAFSLKVFSCIFRSVHNYFRMNFSCSAIIFQLPLSRTSTAFWQQFTNTLTIISIEFQDHSSITSAEAIQHQFIDITAAVGIIFSAYPATFQQRFRNHTRYCISPPQSQELEILYFTAGNCFTSYHKRAGHKIMNALDIHKRAGQQEISLSNFYEMCKGLEHTMDLQFSALWVPTNSFLATRTREECIRESPRVVIVSLEILELLERLPHSFLGPAPNPFMVYDLNASSNHTAMPMTVQMASMSQIQQPNLFGFHLTTAYDCKREDLDSTWEALTYFLTWVCVGFSSKRLIFKTNGFTVFSSPRPPEFVVYRLNLEDKVLQRRMQC